MRWSAGFTLIELLVVVAILAILTGLVMPAVSLVRTSAQKARCQATLRQVSQASLAYASDANGVLVAGFVPTNAAASVGSQWHLLLTPYVEGTQVSQVANKKTGSVLWGCPTWDGTNSRIRATGYGMQLQPVRDDTVTTNSADPSYYVNVTWVSLPAPFWNIGRVFRQVAIPNQSQRIQFADWDDWNIINASNASTLPTRGTSTELRHRSQINALFADGHAQALTMADAIKGFYKPTTLTR